MPTKTKKRKKELVCITPQSEPEVMLPLGASTAYELRQRVRELTDEQLIAEDEKFQNEDDRLLESVVGSVGLIHDPEWAAVQAERNRRGI